MTPAVDAYASAFLTMTLTFDLLTSKYNQFISVPKCTELVNLVKFRHAVYKIPCSQADGRADSYTHARTHGLATLKHNASTVTGCIRQRHDFNLQRTETLKLYPLGL